MDEKKLNFGSGNHLLEGWDNVDVQTSPKLEKSFDFNKIPYPLKDNTYDYVLIQYVLEMLENPDKCLFEIWKKCKSQAIIDIRTVYYNSKGSFNDIQTKHLFTDSTFKHFVDETKQLDKKNKFELVSLKLIPTKFGKIIPKKIRNRLSVSVGGLISQIYLKLKVIK